jgi:hypothetical protein
MTTFFDLVFRAPTSDEAVTMLLDYETGADAFLSLMASSATLTGADLDDLLPLGTPSTFATL